MIAVSYLVELLTMILTKVSFSASKLRERHFFKKGAFFTATLHKI